MYIICSSSSSSKPHFTIKSEIYLIFPVFCKSNSIPGYLTQCWLGLLFANVSQFCILLVVFGTERRSRWVGSAGGRGRARGRFKLARVASGNQQLTFGPNCNNWAPLSANMDLACDWVPLAWLAAAAIEEEEEGEGLFVFLLSLSLSPFSSCLFRNVALLKIPWQRKLQQIRWLA